LLLAPAGGDACYWQKSSKTNRTEVTAPFALCVMCYLTKIRSSSSGDPLPSRISWITPVESTGVP
jgi:hypothetical protein